MARVLAVDAPPAAADADANMEEAAAADTDGASAARKGGRRASSSGKAARASLGGDADLTTGKPQLPKEEKKRKRSGTTYSDATK